MSLYQSRGITGHFVEAGLFLEVEYSSMQQASPLRELTCHSVTYQPTEVTFPPLPQPKLVLDLATPDGCKAELTYVT